MISAMSGQSTDLPKAAYCALSVKGKVPVKATKGGTPIQKSPKTDVTGYVTLKKHTRKRRHQLSAGLENTAIVKMVVISTVKTPAE